MSRDFQNNRVNHHPKRLMPNYNFNGLYSGWSFRNRILRLTGIRSPIRSPVKNITGVFFYPEEIKNIVFLNLHIAPAVFFGNEFPGYYVPFLRGFL